MDFRNKNMLVTGGAVIRRLARPEEIAQLSLSFSAMTLRILLQRQSTLTVGEWHIKDIFIQ